jgi:hypothetical protein
MSLSVYLKQRGIVTGPLAKKVNTSHSSLEVILKYLTNREQFRGGESFLVFGSATHERCLVNISTTWKKLETRERTFVARMEEKFKSHPVIKKLMDGATCEIKKKTLLNGVKVTYILDIHQKKKRRGSDLKTTACKTLEEFIKSAIDYGYFRQGVTYKAAENLLEFIFIGLQKEPPFNVYILDISLYPEEVKYSIEELEFLLYFFQNYGKFEKDKGGLDLRTTYRASLNSLPPINGHVLTFGVADEFNNVVAKGAFKKVLGVKTKTFKKK